jgi:hypothetical protein
LRYIARLFLTAQVAREQDGTRRAFYPEAVQDECYGAR